MLRFQLFLIAIQLLNPVPDNDSIMAEELGILIGGVVQRPLDCGVYLRGI